MIGWLLLAGCPRKLPDHLRLDEDRPAEDDAAEVAIVDRDTALAAVLGRDPLARSPHRPDPAALRAVGEEPLAAFVEGVRAIETNVDPMDQVLDQLEASYADTAVLALSRGYRLRVAENQLLNSLLDPEQAQREVVALLTPLDLGVDDPSLARQPLDFLGGTGEARRYGEQRVLASWLADPSVRLAGVAADLDAPQYDDLRVSPLGALLQARGAGRRSDGATAAFEDLRRATLLSVTRAAADRDAEQGAWADLKRQVAEEVGDPDPVGRLLERARDGLTADAGDDRSAAGALMAIAALRWVGRCQPAEAACGGGLDRGEAIVRAGAWHADLAPLAAAWRTIVLDDVVATLDAGRDTTLFPDAAVDLADALIATEARPLELQVLRKNRPDAGVWLSVARSVGEDGVTDWEGARVALGRHLRRIADTAASQADPESKPLLERIAKRAVP